MARRLAKVRKRHPGKTREMIERITHQFGVAAERGNNVGLNGGVVCPGHTVFRTGRHDHAGSDTQIVTLKGAKSDFRGHNQPQSNRLARRCFI
jgi:hypothetical protein